MKPVEEIKVNFDLHDKVVAMFRGGDVEQDIYDKASREHEKIYAELFNKVMTGQLDVFSIFTNGDEINGQQRIYHRSPKQAGYMQISYIWYHNGELIPTMDAQVKTAADMIRESAPDNVTIKAYKNERIFAS